MKKFVESLLCTVFAILVATMAPFSVYAISEAQLDMFAQNNILFYDPGNSYCLTAGYGDAQQVSTEGTFVSGNDNASSAAATLANSGYKNTSIAAILGNLKAESGINPLRLEKKLNGSKTAPDDFRAWDNGGKTFKGGFGIAQWTYKTRVENLQKYADNNNKKVTSLEVQVGFLIKELSGNKNQKPEGLNAMDLQHATWEIYKNYERPASSEGVSKVEDLKPGTTAYTAFNKRYKFAQEFVGLEPTGLPAGVMGSDGVYYNCVPYSGPGSPIVTSQAVSFLQCDSAWKNLNYGKQGVNGSDGATICVAGCGPVSFAAIAVNLGLSVSPVDAVDVAGKAGMYVNGAGSDWAVSRTLAVNYGLGYRKLEGSEYSVEGINALLRAGKMVHTAGQGGMPFSEGGHYIGIVGVTNSGKWVVVDSGHSKDTAVAEYDPSTVLQGMNARKGSAGVIWR